MIKLPFVRSPDNYDRNAVSQETGVECLDPSLAKQSFAEEVDINTIVRRFNLTGQLPDNVRAPTYADFEGIFDFHSAMNAVASAGEAFDAMPAEVRSRFHNNPAEFVDFCSDEKNRVEAEKLGLLFKKELTKEVEVGKVESRSKEGRDDGRPSGVFEGREFDVDKVHSGNVGRVGAEGNEGGVTSSSGDSGRRDSRLKKSTR